jgi:MoaA/NifB/PqqE/SkfB family radical SAM enzyme
MRTSNRFARHNLSNDDIKRMIDAAAQRGVAAISFTGGEPMLRLNDLAELMNHAGAAGIRFIRTGTNGYFMTYTPGNDEKFIARITRIAATLADTPLRNFWISVDSCEPGVHERMRGFPGLIQGIEKALPIFHDHGIYPSANLGINRNVGGSLTSALDSRDFTDEAAYLKSFYRKYSMALRRFYRRVIDLGFTMVNTCYPMSVDPDQEDGMAAVYAATAEDQVIRFSDAEKAVLFKVILESVMQFRPKIRIFSPLTSLFTLHREYLGNLPVRHPSFACRGGVDFFFVDAQRGETYPCGYRGNESLGKYWECHDDRIDPGKECRLCDWECFRDPSELFAPILQALSRPGDLLDRLLNDRVYLRYWLSDMRYYLACQGFDGRKPPTYQAMQHAAGFSQTPTPRIKPGLAYQSYVKQPRDNAGNRCYSIRSLSIRSVYSCTSCSTSTFSSWVNGSSTMREVVTPLFSYFSTSSSVMRQSRSLFSTQISSFWPVRFSSNAVRWRLSDNWAIVASRSRMTATFSLYRATTSSLEALMVSIRS